MILKSLGLLGTVLFMVSGLPTAWRAWRAGRVYYIPRATTWCVFLGACLMLAYLWASFGFDWIVFLDYSVTIGSWAVVLRYEYFPREVGQR